MSATALCRDNNRKVIYLSNGMVISSTLFDNNQGIKVMANLKPTEIQGRYAIVGSESNQVIGYFDEATRTPTYLSNNTGNNGIIIGSTGMSLNDTTNTGIGGVAAGSVSLDSILGTPPSNQSNTTQTADVSNKIITHEEPVEEQLEFIDGYKFLPIPTDYTDVVIDKISGTAAKWKIKIKQNKKDSGMATGKNPHDEVYKELSATAKETLFEVTELPDTSVLLFGSSSYAVAYMLSDNSKTDITVTTGEQHFGYYDSIENVADVKVFKKNTDIAINSELNVALENKLIALAKQSKSLDTWLRLASSNLNKVEKAALRPYILELYIDHLTTIENQLTFDSDYNPFSSEPDYLLNLVEDNVDDITLRNKYMSGFDKIYARLTNIDNLKNYNVLMYDLPASDKHRLLRVGGISESIPLVISKSNELDIELNKLINSSDDDIFKITDNTPNTLSLVRAIFNNTVKTNSTSLFELSKYTTIGCDVFLLLVDSNILKVLRTEDSLLIRKLV